MEREILLEALSNLKEDSGNLINQLTELMHSSHIAHDNETEEVRPSLEVFQAVALSKVYLQKLFTETRMVSHWFLCNTCIVYSA